jgi:hypothetical protein
MVDSANHDIPPWHNRSLHNCSLQNNSGNSTQIFLADPHDMDMRDRAKAKHVACHPAQRLAGNFLDI